jgi:hypothetical protein
VGRECAGPIVCYVVPGQQKQLGECRCGLIVVGLGHDDIPENHRGARFEMEDGED